MTIISSFHALKYHYNYNRQIKLKLMLFVN